MIPPPEPEWMLWAMRFKLEHQAMVDRVNSLEAECTALRNERTQGHAHASYTAPTGQLYTQAPSTASTVATGRMPLEKTVGSPPSKHQQPSQRVLRPRASHPRQEPSGADDKREKSIPEGPSCPPKQPEQGQAKGDEQSGNSLKQGTKSLAEYLGESQAAYNQFDEEFCTAFLQGLTNAHHRELLTSILGGSSCGWEQLKVGVETMVSNAQERKRHKRTLD